MALRGDSYSSVAKVAAVTRHLLDGQSNFNSTTRPTLTEVEGIIDEVSADLNTAFSGAGLDPASIRTNSTAVLVCDKWVKAEAARWVEMTQRGSGYSDEEGSRTRGFDRLADRAETFVRAKLLDFKRMSIAVADPSHQGLTFTGLTVQADRTDEDDTTLEQPRFTKGKFDAE